MENNSKPQWLIDAEKEIQTFDQSAWGGLTEKEFKIKMRNSAGGKAGGAKNVESGHLANLRTAEHQIKAGKAGGAKNVESGHLANLRTAEHQSKAGKAGGNLRHQQKLSQNWYGSENHIAMSKKGGAAGGRAGGKVTTAMRIQCPYCDKISNPGAIGVHKKTCKNKPT